MSIEEIVKKTRKPKLQINGLTINSVIEFNGLSLSIISKWRQQTKAGRYNLAKGAFLSTYFFKNRKPNKVELALKKLEKISSALTDEELKEDVEYIKNIFLKIKEIDKEM